jgi:SAM-dependent methyltransferase
MRPRPARATIPAVITNRLETQRGSALVQGKLWGRDPQASADGSESAMRGVYEATLDALEPLAGLSHLDVGCGAGLALQMSAARGATVTGLDASDGLLAFARIRLPDADLRVGEIEELPFADESFDVVTAFNSIQYAVDPSHAVAELARVCRSRGRVAIGAWGDPARCETEALFARLRSLAPPPPGTPTPFAISDAGVIEDLLTDAGLRVDGGAEVPLTLEFADMDQAWTRHSAAGPLQKGDRGRRPRRSSFRTRRSPRDRPQARRRPAPGQRHAVRNRE